jgi:hypothetical protein
LSEALTFNDLGTTEMIVRTTRVASATEVEVAPPTSETTFTLPTISRRIDMVVSGGPPGGEGQPGRDGLLVIVTEPAESYDPGDFTLIFDNKLI